MATQLNTPGVLNLSGVSDILGGIVDTLFLIFQRSLLRDQAHSARDQLTNVTTEHVTVSRILARFLTGNTPFIPLYKHP